MKRKMTRLPAEMSVVDALATVGGSARTMLRLLADRQIEWPQAHPQIRLTLTRTAFCTTEGVVTDRGRLAVGMIRGAGTPRPGEVGK